MRLRILEAPYNEEQRLFFSDLSSLPIKGTDWLVSIDKKPVVALWEHLMNCFTHEAKRMSGRKLRKSVQQHSRSAHDSLTLFKLVHDDLNLPHCADMRSVFLRSRNCLLSRRLSALNEGEMHELWSRIICLTMVNVHKDEFPTTFRSAIDFLMLVVIFASLPSQENDLELHNWIKMEVLKENWAEHVEDFTRSLSPLPDIERASQSRTQLPLRGSFPVYNEKHYDIPSYRSMEPSIALSGGRTPLPPLEDVDEVIDKFVRSENCYSAEIDQLKGVKAEATTLPRPSEDFGLIFRDTTSSRTMSDPLWAFESNAAEGQLRGTSTHPITDVKPANNMFGVKKSWYEMDDQRRLELDLLRTIEKGCQVTSEVGGILKKATAEGFPGMDLDFS